MAGVDLDLVALDERALADRLARVVGLGLAIASCAAAFLALAVLRDRAAVLLAGAGVMNSVAMVLAGRAGRAFDRMPRYLAAYGVLGALFYAAVPQGTVTLALPPLLVLVMALVGSQRATLRLAGGLALLHLACTPARALLLGESPDTVVLLGLVPPLLLGILAVVVRLLMDRQDARQQLLGKRLDEIEAVIPAVKRLAEGSLSGEVAGDGELADAVRSTRGEIRALARQLDESAAVLRSVAGVVDHTSVSQATKSMELVQAADALRKTQVDLLGQARRVASIGQQVAEAAAASRRAAEETAQRLDALTATAARVTELHGAIKTIATKSEVLAINAAIEAVHAGEAGRAFSAVVARLQGLSENVREELATAEALQVELLEAATEAGAAAGRSTRAAADSDEAGHAIADTAVQQLRSAEAFTRSIAEIEAFTESLRDQSERGREHAGRVVDVAERLSSVIARFHGDPEATDSRPS